MSRRPRHPALLTASVALGLVLAGCTSSGSNTPGNRPADPAVQSGAAQTSPLYDAIDRFSADAVAQAAYIEAGDSKRLNELAGQDERWASINAIGLGNAGSYVANLAIDQGAATYAVSAGQPPSAVTLIHGGQDLATVREAAEESGFVGDDDTLNAEGPPASMIANQVKLDGEDVIIAKSTGEVDWVDGSGASLTELDDVANALACLEDSIALMISKTPGSPTSTAVGLREDDGGIGTVLCVSGDEDLADEINEAYSSGTDEQQRPYSDTLRGVEVSEVHGMVQAKATLAEGLPAINFLKLYYASDLPGL